MAPYGLRFIFVGLLEIKVGVMKASIQNKIASIPINMLERAMQKVKTRLQECFVR